MGVGCTLIGRPKSICKLFLSFVAALTGTVIIAAAAHRKNVGSPDTYGRSSLVYPSPRCCFTADCLAATKEGDRAQKSSGSPQQAFVSSLRSPEYLPLLRDLHCSLNATNPGIPLLVLAVANELQPAVVAEIETFAQYTEVPNIEFPTKQARYGKNWVKLNAWSLTQYQSLIMLDADTVVLGDLQHIFDMPTDFAWTYLNAPNGYAWNVGGFIMLRPCQAVFLHMLQIVQNEKAKRFSNKFAEQSFLAWYFAYTGYRLPMVYNANFKYLINGTTVGGEKPLVVHFASVKPFNAEDITSSIEYLCHRYQTRYQKASKLFVPELTQVLNP